jgi:putative ABC transport system ATP-binding protein
MLRLEGINKAFYEGTPDEMQLFADFDFHVTGGSFVSIVGSNGSGKTTLLNLICGTLPMDGGHIKFEDRDITGMKEFQRAKFIGRVFQDPKAGTCPSLTILENMALADNKHRRFGLTPVIDRKRIPFYQSLLEQCGMGLENRMQAAVGSLSGGQRQALAIVIASMTDIRLLILDEHTAALDPKSSETIMELTDQLIKKHNITTIMVTHNLRFAVEYGDRLVMMHEGKAFMDIAGEKKRETTVDDLLSVFNRISIEMGN